MRGLTVLLLLAAILAAVYSSGPVPDYLMAGVALLDRSVAIIQAGLLMFLILTARMFGLSGRTFAFGIALGFGVVASTELGVWALRLTSADGAFIKALNFLQTGGYHVSVLRPVIALHHQLMCSCN